MAEIITGGVVIVVIIFIISAIRIVRQELNRAEKHFTIRIPDRWKKEWDPDFLITATEKVKNPEEQYPAGLNVNLTKLSGELDLDKNMSMLNNELIKAVPGEIEIRDAGKTSLDGRDANWIEYFCVVDDNELICLTYMVINERKGFTLTFSSLAVNYDNNKTIFESTAQSLKLK